MQRRISVQSWWAAVFLAGLIPLFILMTAMTAMAAVDTPSSTPGGIQGLLYAPDETTPVAYGWIDIHDAEGSPWMGTDTASDGSFQMANLPPGPYMLTAYPPPGSDQAASLPKEVMVNAGQFSPVALALTDVRIHGWVQDSANGARIGGARVVAHDDAWTVERWATSDTNGEYRIGGLDIGVTYRLELSPPPNTDYVPLPIEYTAVPITSNVVLELSIPPTNVVGIVEDPTGKPVPGAGVVVFREGYWAETAADELGRFRFRGLPAGDFWVHAAPPWGVSGLIAADPVQISLPTPDALVDVGVLTLAKANKTVSGRVVVAGTNNGVENAMVTAHRLDGPGYVDESADANGDYSLSLTGGEWQLRAQPLHPPADWIFPGPPLWVVYAPDNSAETKTANLEVIPTNATVTGRVVCPGGAVCPGEPPHMDISAELRNDDIRHGAELNPDYGFALPIPDGWYQLAIHVGNPAVQAPYPKRVHVNPGQTLDAGDIELWSKDARITGNVRNALGSGVPGVRLVGWQPEGVGQGWAETDAGGVYTMPVIAGEWFVEAQPDPELPYVPGRPSAPVRVAPHGTVAGVNFVLTGADARIRGHVVDADSGERIWGLDGGAWTEHAVGPPHEFEFFSDAPVMDGGFELKVQGGSQQYNVGVEVPPHAPYVSGGVGNLSVAPGAVMSLAVPLQLKNAWMEGALIDALTGNPPAGVVWADVFGEDEQGHWVTGEVDPSSAGYRTGLIDGNWQMQTRVDPASGYVAASTPVTVAIRSGQTLNHNFEVWPIQATIRGQVQKPDGTPAQAFVFAEGSSPFTGYFETGAESDMAGAFGLLVPEGAYRVGATLPEDELAANGWSNPPWIENVGVSTAGPVSGLVLRFGQLDGAIEGTVSFTTGLSISPTHPAYVWAWAESGEGAETEARPVLGASTFTYALQVISDTTWHIGAVYEDWDSGMYYESAEAVVAVPPTTGQVEQDLALNGPWLLPQPFIISFDASQMQTIIMPDGVELRIPPGALAVSGTVTLFIFPTQELKPEPDQEMIGPGYEIWAVDQKGQEITHFNKDIVVTVPYPADASLKQQGIAEQRLVPVYFSTLVGHWILADSYVVDTVNNEITLQISHFTTFGVTSLRDDARHVYLPVIGR